MGEHIFFAQSNLLNFWSCNLSGLQFKKEIQEKGEIKMVIRFALSGKTFTLKNKLHLNMITLDIFNIFPLEISWYRFYRGFRDPLALFKSHMALRYPDSTPLPNVHSYFLYNVFTPYIYKMTSFLILCQRSLTIAA